MEDLIKYIAELYAGPNRDIEIDKKVIKLNEALKALQKLYLYKE